MYQNIKSEHQDLPTLNYTNESLSDIDQLDGHHDEQTQQVTSKNTF